MAVRREHVPVLCEGRRLADRFEEEGALRAALEAAPVVTLRFSLSPS